jgi:hypothetical protein
MSGSDGNLPQEEVAKAPDSVGKTAKKAAKTGNGAKQQLNESSAGELASQCKSDGKKSDDLCQGKMAIREIAGKAFGSPSIIPENECAEQHTELKPAEVPAVVQPALTQTPRAGSASLFRRVVQDYLSKNPPVLDGQEQSSADQKQEADQTAGDANYGEAEKKSD